ncbi:serine/threonine protein kinase [Novipirellula artificiosorum]|uniref:non-specific serine/threonine protein kinase n=1 Tax=Novipirellula artificiosorum TaxID=2528016 RepID=A0A5C6DC60_9BACT|nr:serine/threonine-protein kinase [Novipirellula artificiosorum]TWU34350.1 Serine/threonine-protein kinase PknH [Novipirellula artificiosorum]
MTSPEFLGPYRIGETLGRGGMGAVYSGVHAKTGEKVAVKLISQHIADEPRFRRRFAAEVETLKRLRHKGIVRLVGYGEEEGQLFYSMELVEGESLQQRIRREKKIDWQSTIDIAIEICSALKHAHDIGVIHRDLKPANLLLTLDHSIKLVDFGIAKLFGFGEQTLAGSVLGTADYMAPEQADSHGVTVRTDLYALGSVMYAMLTGRPPFKGKNVTAVIKALRTDPVTPLDLVDPSLPDALVELVHQLLEKDPADRPPTALSVMNRLKAMRAGLQREQTMRLDSSKTRSDEGLESSMQRNALDTNSNRSNPTDNASTNNATTGHDQGVTPVVNNGGAAHPGANAAVTVNSRNTDATVRPDDEDFEASPVAAPEPTEIKTHFQSVDAGHDPSRRPIAADATPADRWKTAISVSSMAAVLIACAILFLKATQQPSADDLYQAIESKRDSGDLLQAQSEIDLFLRRFPEDPRSDLVQQFDDSLHLQRVLRRLDVQNKLGITPLTAVEQGFVDAMKGREQDPHHARERLKQWLAIYDSDTIQKEDSLQQMIHLAKSEFDQLEKRSPQVYVDPRATELINRIEEILSKAPAETSRTTLEGIVDLHADQPWAAPAVEQAKRGLEQLREED